MPAKAPGAVAALDQRGLVRLGARRLALLVAHHHLSTWWEFRDLPNVLFVHYADLKADLETEIRRIADFCDIEVDGAAWPAILPSVGFEAMRAEARGSEDPIARALEGGAQRFFFKGDNGRWRGVLTEEDLALYETAASTLDPVLRRWLEGGRHAIGTDIRKVPFQR